MSVRKELHCIKLAARPLPAQSECQTGRASHDTVNWFPKIARKDYMVGANLSGSGVDDPDAYFFEHYACGSEHNYTNIAIQSSRKCTSCSRSSWARQNANSWFGRSIAA
jgi:hypothetical protein